MVSLQKAFLNPYFWGGYVRGCLVDQSWLWYPLGFHYSQVQKREAELVQLRQALQEAENWLPRRIDRNNTKRARISYGESRFKDNTWTSSPWYHRLLFRWFACWKCHHFPRGFKRSVSIGMRESVRCSTVWLCRLCSWAFQAGVHDVHDFKTVSNSSNRNQILTITISILVYT